jgi:hypothetical protein
MTPKTRSLWVPGTRSWRSRRLTSESLRLIGRVVRGGGSFSGRGSVVLVLRSSRSNAIRRDDTTRSCSRASGAATSTYTTSATTTGNPPHAPPGSSRCAGSTISDIPSRPSRSVHHLHLRPLPLHGRKPDHDRPALRPPRARRARACDPLARRARRGTTSTVDAGGRCVDIEGGSRRQPGQRNHQLSRGKLESPLDGLKPSTPSLPWRF